MAQQLDILTKQIQEHVNDAKTESDKSSGKMSLAKK